MRCLVSRPFLVADDRDRAPAEFCQACDQSFIVAKAAVAVEFDKVRKHQIDPVESVRPLGMARNLGALPGAKVSIKLAAEFEALPFSRRSTSTSLSSVEARRRKFLDVLFEALDFTLALERRRGGALFFLLHSAHYATLLNRLLAADAADGLSSSGFTRIVSAIAGMP